MFVCILSAYAFIGLSLRVSCAPQWSLQVEPSYWSIYLSIYLPIHLSICLSIYLSLLGAYALIGLSFGVGCAPQWSLQVEPRAVEADGLVVVVIGVHVSPPYVGNPRSKEIHPESWFFLANFKNPCKCTQGVYQWRSPNEFQIYWI